MCVYFKIGCVQQLKANSLFSVFWSFTNKMRSKYQYLNQIWNDEGHIAHKPSENDFIDQMHYLSHICTSYWEYFENAVKRVEATTFNGIIEVLAELNAMHRIRKCEKEYEKEFRQMCVVYYYLEHLYL